MSVLSEIIMRSSFFIFWNLILLFLIICHINEQIISLLLLDLASNQSLKQLLLSGKSNLDIIEPVCKIDHLILYKVNHLFRFIFSRESEMLKLVTFLAELLKPIRHITMIFF